MTGSMWRDMIQGYQYLPPPFYKVCNYLIASLVFHKDDMRTSFTLSSFKTSLPSYCPKILRHDKGEESVHQRKHCCPQAPSTGNWEGPRNKTETATLSPNALQYLFFDPSSWVSFRRTLELKFTTAYDNIAVLGRSSNTNL